MEKDCDRSFGRGKLRQVFSQLINREFRSRQKSLIEKVKISPHGFHEKFKLEFFLFGTKVAGTTLFVFAST
jgi:hypothetical protein